jgi:hypothetical protein
VPGNTPECATNLPIADATSFQPFDDEPENEITLTAFRLLTMDLLVLFHVLNEGTINILGRSTVLVTFSVSDRL